MADLQEYPLLLASEVGPRRRAGSSIWPLGLAFVGPGPAGLVLVLAIQFGLVACADGHDS